MSCRCNNNGWGGGCGCQGTVQFAPPPCNPNFPTTCSPLGIGNIQRVVGEDSSSCKYTVPTFSAKSLLSYNSDTGLINWADGSSGNPISLPNLQTGLTTYLAGINSSGNLATNTRWYSDSSNTGIRLNSSSDTFIIQTPDGSGGFNTELSVNSTTIDAGDNKISIGSQTVYLPNIPTKITQYVAGIDSNGNLATNQTWYSDSTNCAVRTNSNVGGFIVQTPNGSGGFNSQLQVNAGNIDSKANPISNAKSLTVNDNGYVSIGSRTETSRNVSNVTLLGFTNNHGYGIYLEPTADPATPIAFANASGSIVGSISTSSSATAFNTSSDYRLKENQVPITNGLARIENLPVYQFNWKNEPYGPKVDGFFAHEAQAIVPESVTGNKDAVDNDGKPIYQAIDQSKLVPLLVAAVKELKAITDAQAITIASLQQSITNTNS